MKDRRYKIEDMGNGSFALRYDMGDDVENNENHSVPVNLTAYEMESLSKDALLTVGFERLLVAIDTLEAHGPIVDEVKPSNDEKDDDMANAPQTDENKAAQDKRGYNDADRHLSNAAADQQTRDAQGRIVPKFDAQTPVVDGAGFNAAEQAHGDAERVAGGLDNDKLARGTAPDADNAGTAGEATIYGDRQKGLGPAGK